MPKNKRTVVIVQLPKAKDASDFIMALCQFNLKCIDSVVGYRYTKKTEPVCVFYEVTKPKRKWQLNVKLPENFKGILAINGRLK